MAKSAVITAILFIFLSIILGAIAAHSLKNLIADELILSFEKGVKYLLYSGLGLLVINLNAEKFNFKLKWINRLLISGTLLFSGNIFLYIFHEQMPVLKNIVHIVPIGGFLMIIGWGLLLYKSIKHLK